MYRHHPKMIPAVCAMVLITTSSFIHWQLQLNVRSSPVFCLRKYRYAPSLSTSSSNNIEHKIRKFWNGRPFHLAHEIVQNVLSNGDVSSQIVKLDAVNAHNVTTLSDFYDGKWLSSLNLKLETFTDNITNPRRRKKQSFCLVLAYDGQHFCGWQRQPQNMKLPSVQEVIENAVEHAFVENGRPDIRVSGRTDSGVHALGQVARVRILSHRAMNDSRTVITTNDVFHALQMAALDTNFIWRCLSVVTASDKFHPTFDSRSRSYVYVLDAKAVLDLLVTILSIDIKSDTEIQQNRILLVFQKSLNSKLKALVGKELDYYSLSYGKVKTESTICCLEHAKVVIGKSAQSESPNHGMLLFEFTGDRFLRRMVRMLVGTCMHHAFLQLSNMSCADFDLQQQVSNDADPTLLDICNSRERTRLVKVAPAEGLIFLGANVTIR